jgi:class 3 adenylate cyclase/tRNA A-37 threonylcarbamoyl transferase component Bud32
LLEFRGAGGAGEVYLGQDLQLDRLVAIKRLRPEVASPEARVQLAHEARINARLEHPNIVRVYDFLSVGGADFIVSEYVDGASLAEGSGATQDLDCQLMRALQISRGLAFAHAAGVVHLDLKSENVLIGRDGVSKIADFGVARRIDAGERHEASGITIRGTFRSMSPEQTRGGPADARSDLFSFGTLLYELFAGLSPFHSQGHAEETIRRIRELRPLPLRELRREVPPALSELVQRLHAKDVADRPESAREVEAVLSELIERRSRISSSAVREPPLERRVLSVLNVELALDVPSAIEECEPYLRQVNRFQQLATGMVERCEGQLLSTDGHRLTICLGYPRAHDNNCERAARLLLELRAVWRHDALGENTPLRAGLDVGDALLSGGLVAGPALAVAAALCTAAAPGQLLVSAAAQRILRRFFSFESRGELCVPRASGAVSSTHFHELRAPSEPLALALPAPPGSGPVLIGRDRELDLLAQAFRTSQETRLEMLFLVGAPGIGKSRLLRCFAELAVEVGASVIHLRARPEDQYSPFSPFAELLAAEGESDPESGMREPAVSIASAGPGSDVCAPPGVRAGGGSYQEHSIGTGLAALMGKADDPPVLVIVDDVHWLDHSSLALLRSLRIQPPQRPLLLVLSGRPECQREVSACLSIQPLSVSRLNAADALELVRALPGAQGLSQRTAARIVEAADGLPLLLEELTLSVIERSGAGARSQLFLDVPSSLTESLDRRLQGLGSARDTVDLLAALGRESIFAILEKLSGLEHGELEAHLTRLTAAGLILDQGGAEQRTLVFRHRMFGEAIYERLPAARREQLHRRIADVMQTSFGAWLIERPEQFVRHFARAGRWLEAVELSVRAGEYAARRSCHFEACVHFRRALELLRSSGLSPEQKERRQQDIERLLCPSVNASNPLPDVSTRSSGSDRPRPQRAATKSLAELWSAFAQACLRQDSTEVSQLLAVLGTLETTPARDCVLALAHGHVAYYRGELRRAEQNLLAAHRLLDGAEVRRIVAACGQELLVDAPCYLSLVYQLRGDSQRAAQQQELAELAAEGLPIARGLNLFVSTSRGLLLREHDSPRGRRAQQARVTDLAALGQRLRHPIFHAVAEVAAGRLELARGERNGLLRMQRGYDLFEDTGARLCLGQFAGFVAEAQLEAGQPLAARELLERARPAASHAYARFYRPELCRIEARVLLAEGRPDQARELLGAVTRDQLVSADPESELLLFSRRIEAFLAQLAPESRPERQLSCG